MAGLGTTRVTDAGIDKHLADRPPFAGQLVPRLIASCRT